METHVIRDNLCNFANEMKIAITFQIVEVTHNEYLTLLMFTSERMGISHLDIRITFKILCNVPFEYY